MASLDVSSLCRGGLPSISPHPPPPPPPPLILHPQALPASSHRPSGSQPVVRLGGRLAPFPFSTTPREHSTRLGEELFSQCTHAMKMALQPGRSSEAGPSTQLAMDQDGHLSGCRQYRCSQLASRHPAHAAWLHTAVAVSRGGRGASGLVSGHASRLCAQPQMALGWYWTRPSVQMQRIGDSRAAGCTERQCLPTSGCLSSCLGGGGR